MREKHITIKLTQREAKAVVDFFEALAPTFCDTIAGSKHTTDALIRAHNKLVVTYRRDINGH